MSNDQHVQIDEIPENQEFSVKLLAMLSNSTVPVMTRQKFAKETGLDELFETDGEKAIAKMMERGLLPSAKIGRHRLVYVDGLRALLAAELG